MGGLAEAQRRNSRKKGVCGPHEGDTVSHGVKALAGLAELCSAPLSPLWKEARVLILVPLRQVQSQQQESEPVGCDGHTACPLRTYRAHSRAGRAGPWSWLLGLVSWRSVVTQMIAHHKE